ncbi:MAG: H-NS histone family protein [Dokdonella sp.]|uniref:H-NS histone family protein n=1 Tax=Dokdonella sp. TaxID=2291710 RepID=UPI0025C34BDB|nr:H-NS histone family protein [Dokdonella sp.]MBK8123996.1 H-NS histone family protein [Dokdonella sp.]
MKVDVDCKELATESILELIAEAEADLAEYRAELNRRKDEILKAMRAELEAKAAALGVSLEDVLASGKKTRAPGAPKYRHPDNGRTWTGRGKRPYWLKDVADIEQYRIS